jgi:Fe-S cluster assembly ATP-binding protein
MGRPAYVLTKGAVLLDGKNIEKLPPDERARLGLFLGFQYPAEVPGVNYVKFLRMAAHEMNETDQKTSNTLGFRQNLQTIAKSLGFSKALASRSLNQDFSGGEKKKAEIVQLSILKPKYAILDEPDSGLDVDALKLISKQLSSLDFPLGLLLITHYQRLLNYMVPDVVHVVMDGKIVKSGDQTLARDIERHGYQQFGR